MTTQTDRLTGIRSSLAIKAPVVTVADSNITLSGEQTINAVAVVDGDRVLVAGQTDTTENGIYVASTAAWSRATDFDGSNDVVTGTLVVNAATGDVYELTSANPIDLGTDAITFTEVFNLDAIVSGSFTGGLTGCATTVEGTITYQTVHNLCTLRITTELTGGSNATAMTMTGLPSAVQPAGVRFVPCVLIDNNGDVPGAARISGSTITFYMASPYDASGFTASQTKGLPAGWTLVYPLA